jgi:hypothetical protein
MKGEVMEKSKKLSIAVLSGVLLIALMVGVAGAGVKSRTSGALGPVGYITVPAAAFSPREETIKWYNAGHYIVNESGFGAVFYTGPIVFPYAGEVKITGISLWAEDNDSGEEACVWVIRHVLSTGAKEDMGSVCSTGSTSGVRKFSDTSISPNKVNPRSYGCYLSLAIGESTDIGVFAVRISYRPIL